MRRFLAKKTPLENLLLELNNVRKIVCREASFFQNPLVTEEQKRKRLNYLFVKDLLDGVNGMVLDHKDRRDNEFVTHQVEGWHKVVGCFILFVTSFGMLYYVYLFSMRQTASRQRAWFNSFLVWFFFEVFVISTGLVFVEHVLIPLWSLRDVQRVKESIVADILIFQKRMKTMNKNTSALSVPTSASKLQSSSRPLDGSEGKEDSKEGVTERKDFDPPAAAADASAFNAAEFLYPSHRLAALFPEYPESALILRYRTPWPKKSFKQGEKSMRKRYDKRFEFVTKTVTRVAMFALSSLIQLPPSFQDLGLQVLLFAVCGGIARLHLQLLAINPFLVVMPSLVVLTVIYVLLVSGRKVRSLISRTYPLAEEGEEEAEDRTKGTVKLTTATAVVMGLQAEEKKESENNELASMRHIAVVALSRESQACEDLSLAEQVLDEISSPSDNSPEEDVDSSSSGSGSDLLSMGDWVEIGSESSSEGSLARVLFQAEQDSSGSGSQ
jgi:hypothetical protein